MTWYRDPPPPFVDSFGRRWGLDGQCLDHDEMPGFGEMALVIEFAFVRAYHEEFNRLTGLDHD